MPSDWIYKADGVETAVETTHSLDGSIKTVIVQLDAFKYREHNPEDQEDVSDHWVYAEEKDLFEEFKDGSNARAVFDVSDGEAEIREFEPMDGDAIKPRHFMLLPAMERVVLQLTDVGTVVNPLDSFTDSYINAEDIQVYKLDGDI